MRFLLFESLPIGASIIALRGWLMIRPKEIYLLAIVLVLLVNSSLVTARENVLPGHSKFLPETEDTTSYFSFFDVAEKIGIVIGMLIYGFIDQITGSMRNSILFLFVFFLLGIIMLFRVPKAEIQN